MCGFSCKRLNSKSVKALKHWKKSGLNSNNHFIISIARFLNQLFKEKVNTHKLHFYTEQNTGKDNETVEFWAGGI